MASLLAALARFFETDFQIFSLLLLVAGLLTFKRRIALLIAIVLVLAVTPYLKSVYAQERPCVAQQSLFECPGDYGFPSGHATVATVFAAASLGSTAFFFFAPLAAIVSYSRVYAGVHSLEQVAAGVALGLALYALALGIRSRFKKTGFESKWKPARQDAQFEWRRQVVHILFGAALIGAGVLFGKTALLLLLLLFVAAGMAGSQLEMVGVRVPLWHNVLQAFERREAFPAKGALNYVTGALLAVSFSPSFEFALATIALLAFGDGFSTIIGKHYGKTKLHWNGKKTWKGSIAFFVAGGVFAYAFIGSAAFAYSLALAFIESLDSGVDDNLLVPVAALLLNFVAARV